MKNDCIFCSIVSGKIPSFRMYEDEIFVAILDRYPKCMGHVLIIPKQHADNLLDLPPDALSAILPVAQKIASAICKIMNCEGFNLLQNNGKVAGQEVPHFHLHLIPRFKDDGMVIKYTSLDPSPDEFTEILEKFKDAL